jgi:ElaB/YqjD/DUF883 family membrane-anchored ribosome-binding protein
MEKMTKREIYAQLITLADTGKMELSDADLKAFAEKEIELLDKKAAKAKEAAAKKRAEGDELTDAVRAALSDDTFEPIAEIAARIEGADVTVAKVTYRLTQLVKNGEAEKQEITIPATEDGGKARKIQGYCAITK